MSETAYAKILAVARDRFSADGYAAVTIRAIAAEAGYSAAMVMKLMGSKERLFWLVAPDVASTAGLEKERDLVPKEDVGRELVRRIFARRRMEVDDPYAVAPLLVKSAPDPAQIRIEIWDRYVHNMAAMIGDTTPDEQHAKAVVAMMLGVAASVHTMDAYEADEDERAIAVYAGLVQAIIDRCDGPRLPLPDESVGITAAADRAARRED